ncbi:MAG: SGNH/GDSL hydrolase family protein [Actinomycetota bacterium]
MPNRPPEIAPRFLFVLLGLILAVATACGGNTTDEADEPDTSPAGDQADASAEGDQTDAQTQSGRADGEVRLLAIGDSVLDFSGEASTPQRVGVALESEGVTAEVVNRAIGGTCLLYCGRGDERIPERYVDRDWTHVLISGGGNDLGELEGECRPPDPLMSADLASGTMVDLVDGIPGDVVVLLYRYSSAVPLEELCPEVSTLMERYAAFAAERTNVVLVDANVVSGPDTPELWADNVHPNEEGSDVIGRMIADLILDADR